MDQSADKTFGATPIYEDLDPEQVCRFMLKRRLSDSKTDHTLAKPTQVSVTESQINNKLQRLL